MPYGREDRPPLQHAGEQTSKQAARIKAGCAAPLMLRLPCSCLSWVPSKLPAALVLDEQASGELQGLGAARLLIRAGALVLVGTQAVGQHGRRQAQAQVVGVLRTGGTRTHNVGNRLL